LFTVTSVVGWLQEYNTTAMANMPTIFFI